MLFDPLNAYEIYVVKSVDTGKVKYVGQTALYHHTTRDGPRFNGYQGRWKSHVQTALRNDPKSCRILYNAIRKNRPEAYVCESYIWCASLRDANKWEEQVIADLNTLAPNGYNIKRGGDNHRHHEETKRLISESQKGKVYSDETKLRISEAKKQIPLPTYIRQCNDSKRIQFGFEVHNCPGLEDRKFVSNKNDEDVLKWQLKRAEDYIAGKHVPEALGNYNRDEAWRKKCQETRAKNIQNISTRPYSEYITDYKDRGSVGYQVLNYPNLQRRSCSNSKLTDDEKYQYIVDYIEGKIPPRKAKAPKTATATTRKNGLPLYIFKIDEKHTRKKTQGYKVKDCPGRDNKYFTSKDLTMEQKFSQAVDYMNGVFNHPEERKLPKYIYEYTFKAVHIGYSVSKHKNVPFKLFANKEISLEENLKMAVQHIQKYA